ncbi:MAG: hypothetical protein PVJ67_03040 [Candidatus Pacearchaeota archaeon]|jgi:fibronectin type 3 domain-containing protein
MSKFNLLILVLFLLVSCFGGIISANPSFDYNFDNDSSGSYEFFSSSIILEVHTNSKAECKWDTANFSFSAGGNSFDSTLGFVHKKILIGLEGNKVYDYYVKCLEENSSNENNLTRLKLSFLINPLITGQVNIPNSDSPLTAGRVDVTLHLTKPVSSVPILKYSFDGLVYNPLTLAGTGQNWAGYLIVEDEIGEGLLSFRLDRIVDLEGSTKENVELTNGAVYAIDTIKPKTVSAINAQGYNGGIELKWHLDEEFNHFNLYRSESAGVAYTDLYNEDIEGEFFRDTSVVSGRTYYYKVSAVDDAGNEGDLSIEVYAAPSSTSETVSQSGLSLNLIGEVNSLINEIDFATGEVEEIKSAISYKTDKEKELFSLMKLDSEINNAISSFNSLKKDVEKYKQQDLTKQALDQKIASSRLKIEAIKKKIPEDIAILREGSDKEINFNEDNLREAIIEANPLHDEAMLDKSFGKSRDLIKERGLEVISNFYVAEVLYSDGQRKTFSVVKREMNSKFDKSDDGNFIEIIPKEVIDTASKIKVGNLNYDVIKDDPVLSFDSSTKDIFYFFEGDLGIDLLKETFVIFVSTAMEEESKNSITGYFLFEMDKKKSTGVALGIVLILCVGGYLFYRRRNLFSENYFNLSKRLKEVNELIGKDSIESMEKNYNLICSNYNSLAFNEKNSIYSKVESLRDKIFILRLEAGLVELKKSWDKNLFLKLEKIYNALTDKNKKKIEKVFLQVKRDVELKEMEAQGEIKAVQTVGDSSGKKEEEKNSEKEGNKTGEVKNEIK